ncbi:MAG: NFACT family protein [Lachnospiraceae bacterium]|nr:NFACT family protein [Lachnospiraceae bacterium]
MALDGITIRALTNELHTSLVGGRISKIIQPEADELMLTIKTHERNERLLISAGASLPFVYLTDENKQAPMQAPNFCMLLRKHISGGHITAITQPGLERIIEIEIEHLDEMGDVKSKILTIELMGKHSNIIFRHPDGVIIDSIKHVSAAVSSVREVLPGRGYFIPKTEGKIDITDTNMDSENTLEKDACLSALCKPIPLIKSLYTTFTGFSPAIAASLCEEAGLDGDRGANTFDESELCKLSDAIDKLGRTIAANDFHPAIIVDEGGNPVEFEVTPLAQYRQLDHTEFKTVSEMLIAYYAGREVYTRIRQKSADLRKIVSTALERCVKKFDLQQKQLKDTEKMDKYKVYGELLQTYGYSAPEGADKITCDNYYTNEPITIPLDPTISAMANSVKYFDRYNKLKRTKEAVSAQLEETKADIEHLRSVMTSLDIAVGEEDLSQIKDELTDSGYIRRKSFAKQKRTAKSSPFHFISSDGFHIYVGKNNYQNDELTFKVANSGDWWFHAKKITGSHVIVKCEGKELPDRAFEEAASLAAYYSSGRSMGKVEIDYVQRKEVKKPSGAKPGFVVYYTNYSMVAAAQIPDGVTEAELN